MTTPEMEFAAILRQSREERGWTLHDLAMRSGVTAQKISRMERGNCRINLNDHGAIVAAFQESPTAPLEVGWTVTSVDVDTPIDRHTVCGDIVEWEPAEEDGVPCCKTCGPVPEDQVKAS